MRLQQWGYAYKLGHLYLYVSMLLGTSGVGGNWMLATQPQTTVIFLFLRSVVDSFLLLLHHLTVSCHYFASHGASRAAVLNM